MDLVAGMPSPVYELENGGVVVGSLHLLCSPTVLSATVRASVVASAKTNKTQLLLLSSFS